MAAFSAIASLVVGAASAVGQANAAKKQSKAQRSASEAQSRASSVEAQKSRIAQVREARIRRGQVLASGSQGALGFAGTSGIQGALGSISTQMADNIGSINQQQTFAAETSAALQKATDFGVKAQKFQLIGQVSQSIFQSAGGFTTIFGGNTIPKAGK